MACDNFGAKNGSGVYQKIINLMPPHHTYIELFGRTGAILKKKAQAQKSIFIDIDKKFIDKLDYAAAEKLNMCAFDFLKNYEFSKTNKTLIYADPPYHHSTRTSKTKYKYDFTHNEHIKLLNELKSLPSNVMCILSGYDNELYQNMLKSWFSTSFQSMTRGGVRTETVWCNFEPSDIHYHTYAGENFTDRQRIQRKAQRWAKNYMSMSKLERAAVMSAMLVAESENVTQR